jgi:hypothetical protein
MMEEWVLDDGLNGSFHDQVFEIGVCMQIDGNTTHHFQF